MTTRAAWVLGAGGLLGSNLARAFRQEKSLLFEPAARLHWSDPSGFAEEVKSLMREFAAMADRAERWTVAWAAGVGSMGSSRESMSQETRLLECLLEELAKAPSLRSRPGSFFFASTAGGVYAGSSDDTITERSATLPRAPYGEEKLKQEELVREWTRSMVRTSSLIARISTLYGSGQARNKSQGLISHVARCIVRDRPIHIFVPLDTVRDYLHAGDAARDIAGHLAAMEPCAEATTKIVASETSTTIAQIVAWFEKVSRRRPLLVTSASPLSAQYVRRQCFRSVVPPLERSPCRTTLLVGIAEVLAHERLAFATARVA